MNLADKGNFGYKEKAGKYLTFLLDGRRYAFSIKKIIEIIEIQDITPVPECPDYMKGIINLRGRVIPLVDMRLRFKRPETEYNKRTCIIIIDMGETAIGFIVDRVEEVTDISADEISPPPAVTLDATGKYVMGVGKVKGDIVLLLDHERLFSKEELENIEKAQ